MRSLRPADDREERAPQFSDVEDRCFFIPGGDDDLRAGGDPVEGIFDNFWRVIVSGKVREEQVAHKRRPVLGKELKRLVIRQVAFSAPDAVL